MTRIVGLGLLASAFAPLILILTFVRFGDLGKGAWLIVFLCLCAVGLLGASIKSVGHVQERPLRPKSVRRADERVLAFTSSFIVPIVVATFGEAPLQTVAATAAIVALMAIIYVRAGLYHLNPTLAICGYRLYEVTAANGEVVMLLSKNRRLGQKRRIMCRYLGDDVAIQTGARSAKSHRP